MDFIVRGENDEGSLLWFWFMRGTEMEMDGDEVVKLMASGIGIVKLVF